MCSTVGIPPMLWIASPAQAPAAWFLLILELLGSPTTTLQIPARLRGIGRYIGIGAFSIGWVGVIVGTLVGPAAYGPWYRAMGAWYDNQLTQLSRQGCNTDALQAMYNRMIGHGAAINNAANTALISGIVLLFIVLAYVLYEALRVRRILGQGITSTGR